METLTLDQVCKLTGKSRKTISRYISQGKLKPETTKSDRGTLRYLFRKDEVSSLCRSGNKNKPNTKENQQSSKKTGETRQDVLDGTDGTLSLVNSLNKTIQILEGQVEKKDQQIEKMGEILASALERNREANILLKGSQDRLLSLRVGKPKKSKKSDGTDETRQDRTDGTFPKKRKTPKKSKAIIKAKKKEGTHETGQGGTRWDTKAKGFFAALFRKRK